GHELDVVHGEDVRRIRHRDGERAARAAQRNDLIFPGGFVWNELDDRRVELELREVDGGEAVLLAEQSGDLVVLDELYLDEVEAELSPVGLLLSYGLLQLLGRDQLFFEEELAYSNGHERLRLHGLDKICQ